jgi:hypothetical protein
MDKRRKCPVCDHYLEEETDKCENCGTIISYFINNEKSISEEKPHTTTRLHSKQVFSFLIKEDTSTSDMDLNRIDLIREEEELSVKKKGLFRNRILGWIFDIFLISTIWLFSLIIASVMLKVKLFKLLSSSYPQLIAFFFILLFIYLFFFILFFKRTLGEFIFSKND